MRLIGILIVGLSISTKGMCNEYLKTMWIEIGRETNCRFIIDFTDDGEYFVLNECPIGRETGIRETGKFRLEEESIVLESRIVMWKDNLFESSETKLSVKFDFTDGYLLITEGKKQSKFKRVWYPH